MNKETSQAKAAAQIEEMFEKYRNIARKLAGRFAQRFNKPYDEVLAEAEYLLAEKVCNWDTYFDASKGRSGSSWIYFGLHKQLLTYCTRQPKPIVQFSAFDTDDGSYEPSGKVTWLQRLLHDLSDEARELVETIVHAPYEIADELTGRARIHSRRTVHEYLLKQGWTNVRLQMAWSEVARAI